MKCVHQVYVCIYCGLSDATPNEDIENEHCSDKYSDFWDIFVVAVYELFRTLKYVCNL